MKSQNTDDRKMLNEERISAYLRGEMNETEETAFIEELRKNEELRNQAIDIARLAKEMKVVGAARDRRIIDALLCSDLDTVKKTIQSVTQKRKAITTSFKKRISVIASIAASVAIVLFIGFQYNNYRTTTGLGDKYCHVTESVCYYRGEIDTKASMEVSALINNVKNGTDLKNTNKRLALLWELSTMEIYNDYTDLAPKIGWYLSLGYLKDNDRDNAKDVLDKLTTIYSEGTAIGDMARELIKKL